METAPVLIYCAGGNARFAAIAVEAGFRYGARLPDTCYGSIYFADQDWRRPDRGRYMAELRRYRPALATVLDWERPEQLSEVMDWAAEAAESVTEAVIVVPKAISHIDRLPTMIGSKELRLGYSVPTRFAGTPVPAWEFAGRPVHLLGGSPQRQMALARYLDVRSADGNYAQKLATRHCQYWVPGTARYANNRWWPTLQETGDGVRWQAGDAPYEAFRRSCQNVIAAWGRWPE